MRLRKLLIPALVCCLFGAVSFGAAKTARKPAASAKKTTASAGKSSSARKKNKSKTASRKKAGPPRQMAPTPERYMEVQQALADKGYYTGPIDGNWDGECVQALRRFQGDQKIPVDGKLGALSLIGLGLGPKREPLQTQFLSKPESLNPTP